MSGTFTEPRFVGVARSDGVDFSSIGRTALSAEFDASARALRATNIDADIGSTTIRGEVLADLVSRKLDGRLEVASPNAADLLSALPEGVRLQGPLSATATLDGTVDTPGIVAEVSGKDLTLAEQPIASLTATARVVGDGVMSSDSPPVRKLAGSSWRRAATIGARGLTPPTSMARI